MVTPAIPASPESRCPLPFRSSYTLPPVLTSGTSANVYPVPCWFAPRLMLPMTFGLVSVPPAVPALSLPVWLAGVVGWVSVRVYVPAARLVKLKLPWASVWTVSGADRLPPESVIVTPWIPVSGLLNVPELLKSRNTRPAMLAVAGVTWNTPKSTVRSLWPYGVLRSLLGLSPVGMPGPRVIDPLWMTPPEPNVPDVVPLSFLSVVLTGAGSKALAVPVLDWNENSTPPVLKLLAASSTM